MTDKKRIADNESAAELLNLLKGASTLENLWHAFPSFQQAFPKLSDFSEKLAELKEQSRILLLPDRFNEIFASAGWIAYDLNPCSTTPTVFSWRTFEIFSIFLFGFAPFKHFFLRRTGTKRQLSALHSAVLLTAHTALPSACAECCNGVLLQANSVMVMLH